eukprot:320513-Chlamydomonas_euryale.AAC.2
MVLTHTPTAVPTPRPPQLQELLGMKGKHQHKLVSLRSDMTRMVFDDARYRVWYPDPLDGGGGGSGDGRVGVVFKAARGQVNMEKPEGLTRPGGGGGGADGIGAVLQVVAPSDPEELRSLQVRLAPRRRGFRV